MKTFSVIIPTFNRLAILQKTLAGLGRQSFPSHEFEVIVVDDGSTDGTREFLETAKDLYPFDLVPVSQQNRKQGAARNRGLETARGRLVLLLGDDIVPAQDLLRAHALRHDTHPGQSTGVVGYTTWPADQPVSSFMRYIGEQGWQFGYALIEDPENLPFNFFYTSNVSLATGLLRSVGGFDEDFNAYGWEDMEIALRLQAHGLKLVYAPAAVAYHYHSVTFRQFCDRQRTVGASALALYRKQPQLLQFLHLHHVPRYRPWRRFLYGAAALACRFSDRFGWPDCGWLYPNLMTYYYFRGVQTSRAVGSRAET